MTTDPQHVGFAGRCAEQFRFEGDDYEISLSISAELGQQLASILIVLDPMELNNGPLGDLRRALKELGFE